MGRSRKGGGAPSAYTRFTKTHWLLYVRFIVRRKGYSYVKKTRVGRRVVRRRVRVPAASWYVYRLTFKERFPVSEHRVWLSRKEWFRGFEDNYENFSSKRSDRVDPSFQFFRIPNDYLGRTAHYPPERGRGFRLVWMYFMVWHPQEEEHRLWAQSLKISGNVFPSREDVSIPVFTWVAQNIHRVAEEQIEKLEDSPQYDSIGVEVKGLVGWGVMRREFVGVVNRREARRQKKLAAFRRKWKYKRKKKRRL